MRILVLILTWCLLGVAADHVQPNSCPGGNCRIQAPVKAIEKQFEKKPFNPKACPAGIPLSRLTTDGKSPQLGAGQFLVGREKSSALVPIVENPASFLEPGDILIYTKRPGAMGLLDHALEGFSHSAVILNREGTRYHLDSPPWMSSDDFTGEPFHILRFSLYPPEVRNEEDRARWLADPKLRKKLDAWTENRQKVIGLVQEYGEVLIKNGFKYDPTFFTEVLNPTELKLWQTNFKGQCSKGTPELYCSELPLLLYASAGQPLVRAQSIYRTLEKIEKEDLPRLMAGGKTREQVIEEQIKQLFQMNPAIGRMSESQKAALRATLTKFLNMTANERQAMLSALELLGVGAQIPITPADFFNSIHDENGYLAYVGTYVGDACQKENAVAPEPSPVPYELAQKIKTTEHDLIELLKDLDEVPLSNAQRKAKADGLQREMFELRDDYFLARAKLSQQIKAGGGNSDWQTVEGKATEWKKLAQSHLSRLQALQLKLNQFAVEYDE
jgi:hypothetical protein